MRQSMQGHRWLAVAALVALAAAVGIAPAGAVTSTASQTTTATVGDGTLAVTVQNGTLDFGTVAPAGTSSAIAVGYVDHTNTLNNGNAWSTTVVATPLTATGYTAIPYTNLTLTIGTTIAGQGETAGTPSAGTGGAFAGTGGSSNAMTVLSATAGVAGTFRQSGSTITLHVPVTAHPGTVYSGTLQYTITG